MDKDTWIAGKISEYSQRYGWSDERCGWLRTTLTAALAEGARRHMNEEIKRNKGL